MNGKSTNGEYDDDYLVWRFLLAPDECKRRFVVWLLTEWPEIVHAHGDNTDAVVHTDD